MIYQICDAMMSIRTWDRVHFIFEIIVLKVHQCRFENLQIKCLCLHTKMICRRFRIITAFTFWVMRTRDIWKVCLQTYRNNRICSKVAYFLRKIQTARINNSRILRIKNANFSGYWLFLYEPVYIEKFSNLN